MPGLWTPKGEFIEFSEIDHKALTSEVATPAARGELDVGGMLAAMPDPDPVLLKKGDDAQVLDDLMADDQVCTAVQARKTRVLNNRDYDFGAGLLPGKEATPAAVKLCEELTKDLENIPLLEVFSAILDTPFYGFSVLELMWEARAGKYHLVDIVPKPRAWFTFDKDRNPALRPAMGGDPTALPAGKFLVPRHFPTYENPYGVRLLSRCLWPVAFKRGGVEFYTRFLERFGMPWPVGEAPKGATTKEKQEFAADLARMVQDAVVVIPHGATVKLIESKGTGGLQFEKYLMRWDKAILKVIMGQTLTAEMDGQGSRAAAEVHKAVAADIAESDQLLVESTLNELALIYRDINAADVEAPVFAYHEPEDYDAQAKLDLKLYKIGVRFTQAHFARRFRLTDDEYKLEGEAEPPGDGLENKKFSENRPGGQAVLDMLVRGVLPEAASQNDKFVKKLLDLLDKAESWEEMQLLLAGQLGGALDQDGQGDLLADLMAAADLAGRAAAKAEADGD